MTEEQIALARRAVACRGWRWMAGMSYWWNGHQDRVADTEPGTLRTNGELLPDLTDPATLGCVLALVREAHQQDSLSPVKVGRDRWCLADYGTTALDGDTEAALLVAALEAAE